MTAAKQGTLIVDNGKVGIVIRVYTIGVTGDMNSAVRWETSYHIFYSDGTFSYLSQSNFDTLLNMGIVKIL